MLMQGSMSPRYNLQEIIEKIYWVNDRYTKNNNFEETSFKLTYKNLKLEKLIAIKDFVAYKIADINFDSILAVGSANPCEESEIEDYMLTYLDVFFEKETVVDEISKVIIDDMPGIEIFANIVLDDKQYTLHSCYLTDNIDAYLIVALIDPSLTALNTELYSLVRSFVRDKKSKSRNSKILDLLNDIDKKLAVNDKKVLHQMLAVRLTFGEVDDISIRRAFADSFVDYEFHDIYKNIDIMKELNEILKLSKNVPSLQALIISSVVSSTPSITYYKKEDDDDKTDEHTHEHIEDELYVDDKKVAAILIKCAEFISNAIDDDAKYGMVLLIRENDFIDFAAYCSYGGAYIPVEIGFDDDINHALQMILMDVVSATPTTNNNFLLTEIAFDNAAIRSKKISDKVVNVAVTDDDIYFDLTTSEGENEYLEELATVFYDKLNEGDEAISSITINLDVENNKAKSLELVMAKTFDGYKSLLYASDEVAKIEENINEILKQESNLNTVVLKIYPAGKLSIKYIYN